MTIAKSAFALACLLTSLAALAQSPTSTQPATTAAGSASSSLSQQDEAFLTKAASSGRLEVEAGKLAESKAQDKNVKQFAEMLVKDHSHLNEQLQSLAETQRVSLPGTMNEKDSKLLESLKTIPAGRDFDKTYVMDQVKCHKDAVDLFEKEASTSTNADIRSFAAKGLPVLEKHLSRAKALEKKY